MILSVVVPCFNEESVIRITNRRLVSVLESMKCNYEITYVDDGSTDETNAILQSLCLSNPSLQLVTLTRNYGQQLATSAGLKNTAGDAVVIIDADLQDPPELIPQMFQKWKDGIEVVFAVRTTREDETWFKKWTSKVFSKLLNVLSEVPVPENTGDFQLLDRRIVDALMDMPERDRFLRGMIAWTGYRRAPLYYTREPRQAGYSKYPVRKMLNFALDGIFSFSSQPLRVATMIGGVVSLMATLGIFYAITMRVLTDNWVSGWTFLVVTILLLGGIQLIFLGIIGEYIARIYNQSKGRPLFLVDINRSVFRDTKKRKSLVV